MLLWTSNEWYGSKHNILNDSCDIALCVMVNMNSVGTGSAGNTHIQSMKLFSNSAENENHTPSCVTR